MDVFILVYRVTSLFGLCQTENKMQIVWMVVNINDSCLSGMNSMLICRLFVIIFVISNVCPSRFTAGRYQDIFYLTKTKKKNIITQFDSFLFIVYGIKKKVFLMRNLAF